MLIAPPPMDGCGEQGVDSAFLFLWNTGKQERIAPEALNRDRGTRAILSSDK